MKGLTTDPAPVTGDPVVAVFRPSAVSVFREPPGGSRRNVIATTVTDLEPLGDQVRVRAASSDGQSLAADITTVSAAELDLVPGCPWSSASRRPKCRSIAPEREIRDR